MRSKCVTQLEDTGDNMCGDGTQKAKCAHDTTSLRFVLTW